MPRWFRAAVAVASVVTCASTYWVKPHLAPAVVVLAALLNLLAGAGTVAIARFDRASSGDDDPASLNLHR